MKVKSTKRFSNRVEHYTKYRPTYPDAVLDCLRQNCGLGESAVMADVGSGTGILSRLLLQHQHQVYGVEPNKEMREAAEVFLQGFPNFVSVKGTAENTTLPDQSVDFITVGQAFHWFDADKAKVEFQRILRPGGLVALVWNVQDREGSVFMRRYQEISAEFSDEYLQVKHQEEDEAIRAFFDGQMHKETFTNAQIFDFEGFKGRALSSSYMPLPGHPNYEPLMVQLRQLFEAHQENGRVRFSYLTHLFWGQWS